MKIFILSLLIVSKTYASSCCGGGSASSLVTLGDNRSEASISISSKRDLGHTDNQGYSYFSKDTDEDFNNKVSIQYQYLFDNYLQTGFSTSFGEKTITKNGNTEKTSHIGDFVFQLSYEFMPEINYNPLKPRGFVFLKTTIPNTPSIYDSKTNLHSDVQGSGFYSITIGNLFAKSIDNKNIKLSYEWNHSFKRKFNQLTVDSFDRFGFGIGASTSFTNFPNNAVGVTQNYFYTFPKKIYNPNLTKSQYEQFFETGINYSYSIDRTKSISLSYLDTTLFGKSINSPLYRSVALSTTYQEPL